MQITCSHEIPACERLKCPMHSKNWMPHNGCQTLVHMGMALLGILRELQEMEIWGKGRI